MAILSATAAWNVVGCGGSGGGSVGGDEDTGAPTDDTGGSGDSTIGGDTGIHLDTGSGDSSKTDTGATGDTGGSKDTGASTDSGSSTDTGAGVDTAVDDTSTSSDTGASTDSGSTSDTGSTVDTGTGVDTAPSPCGTGACSVDSDGDTIPDSVEGECLSPPTDTDGDGTADYLDLDSDNDSIPDQVEWAAGGCDPTAPYNDADGDGLPNFRDLDSDENGLPDRYEICPVGITISGCGPSTPADSDGDGAGDWLDGENDHDSPSPDPTIGLEDKFELVDNAGVYKGPRVNVPYVSYDTSVPLIDTDSDGIPDVWDRDADNDNIFDLTDGLGDPDKDAIPNFRDGDSDGDGVKDVCEARANPVFTPTYAEASKALLDTNGDGIYDYLQRDTDGDYLLDGTGPLGDPTTGEDKNGNCIVDATETDRLKPDTDGDGVSDFIEVTLVSVACAKDPTCTPASKGLFYFLEPYSPDGSAAPTPTSSPLGLKTDLQQGDVGFIVDTTGSMSGEIANLKSSLSTTIIPALKTKIPSLGVGVAAHDDIPYCTSTFNCYGDSAFGDKPFYIASPPNGYVTTTTATSQTAVNSLVTHDGYDYPEAQIEAIYLAISGASLSWPKDSTGDPAGSVGPFSPPAGTFGALQFRNTALPIVIEITDAAFHNGKRALDLTGTSYDGTYQYAYTTAFSTYNVDDVVTKFNALGAKFIGVAADNGPAGTGGARGLSDPYQYEAYITDKTGSNVPASAFGGACGTGKCCTGVSGAAYNPDGPGGNCRSVYSINTSGTGLSNSIVNGVYAILASIKFDVHVQATPCTAAGTPGCSATDAIDAVNAFMSNVLPSPSGGTDPSIGTCISFINPLADRFTGPKATAGADGTNETILQVNPGPLYCFNVTPKPNTTVAPTASAQLFHASLQVIAQNAGSSLSLGSPRGVLFLVPPIIN